MRRSEFLAVTGAELDLYKNWRARGNLPYYDKEQHAEETGKHTEFSLLDCFKMRLALDLTEGFGLSPSTASWCITFQFNGLLEHLRRIDAPVGNLLPFLAAGDFWLSMPRERDDREPRFDVLQGFDGSMFAPDTARVILLNASGAARFVLAKADALGLSDE